MNSKSNFVVALSFVSLGASSALVGCTKEAQPTPAVSASNNASSQLSATEKAEAERAAADKAVRDKVATDKTAADKAAAHTKAESASLPAGLVETKAEITRTMAQMDVTMAKLDSLAVASGDLDDPSEIALASIDTLESEIKALQERAETMRDRGAAYFEAWDKQLAAMSAPEVVELATKRKDELTAKYTEVLTAMQECRSALDAYWGDMKSIRQAVDDDLTPETQKALGPQVKAAKEKAATLKMRVEATSAKLNQVSQLYTKP